MRGLNDRWPCAHGQVRYDDGDEEAMLFEKLLPLLPKGYTCTRQPLAASASGANRLT